MKVYKVVFAPFTYNGGHNGLCLAYIGNISNFDTNNYGHHCTWELDCGIIYVYHPFYDEEVVLNIENNSSKVLCLQ